MNTPPLKVAVVTGAGSGVGRAVALELLGTGYAVVLAGRREQALEETRTAAGADATRALVVPTDVTKEEEVRRLFDTAQREYGRVDVNLTGMFLCAQAAFRVMRYQDPQGGRIINNGSISAHAPRPMSIAYTSTKHAITGLTKSLSLDGRAYNIACGQVDIGNAGTDMTQRMKKGIIQANGDTRVEPVMDVAHVAQTVRAMCEFPLETNVQFVTIMATKMPYVGRG